MEDGTKRTIEIIGTVVTTLSCGCMGLYSLWSGAMIISGNTSLFVNSNTGREIDSISDGKIRLYMGLFMIAVPVVIAYFTFRWPGVRLAMEDNTKRTIGIIGTVVTTLSCGCLGLYSLWSGAMIVFWDKGALFMNSNNGGEIPSILDGKIRLYMGLFMIAVPAVIAFFTFRRRPGL